MDNNVSEFCDLCENPLEKGDKGPLCDLCIEEANTNNQCEVCLNNLAPGDTKICQPCIEQANKVKVDTLEQEVQEGVDNLLNMEIDR